MAFSRLLTLAAAAVAGLMLSGTQPPPAARAPAASVPAQPIHDPCIIKSGSAYYVYATGPGIPMFRSKDLVRWEPIGQVFAGGMPDWIKSDLPNSRGIWAPDISFYRGRYHLFYAVSSFGSNRSVIGSASNRSLDPADRDYQWTDDGKAFESVRSDNFNAIDPNVLPLSGNRLALTFGSFWSGIKLVLLDARTNRPIKPSEPISLARRPSPDAEEAPFLVRRGRYYYLFVSFDYCCRGVNSTYNTRVGRSETLEGPYVDRDGRPMLEGGGTKLLETDGDRIGPGHCAVLHDGEKDYLAYHYYDGRRNGFPTLQICPIRWTPDEWPEMGKPLE